MAIDYANALATATRLIKENGRALTLVKRTSQLADPAKPWGPTDPAGTGESIATIGVFLDLNVNPYTAITAGASLGASPVSTRQQRILVPAEAALPEEMGEDWQVQDGDLLWEVNNSNPLKPGGVLIFYSLEVSL